MKTNKNIWTRSERAQMEYIINRQVAKVRKEQEEENERRSQLNSYISWLQFMYISIVVLQADYWPKTAKKRIPEFLNTCMSVYEAFCYDAITLEQMEEDIKENAGINTIELLNAIRDQYIKDGIITGRGLLNVDKKTDKSGGNRENDK